MKEPGVAVEISVDSVESARAAASGGAERIELCSDLAIGGLTPSLGLIEVVRRRVGIGLHVMIRPRGGDFLYSEDELGVMRADIRAASRAGADGVVLGLLDEDGNVEVERTRELVELSGRMEVTFHRAIDMARDFDEALEAVIASGVARVLTSGAEPTAFAGRASLQRMVEAARGRIAIMAGGGVRAANVREIARASGVRDFHASLRHATPSPARRRAQRIRLTTSDADHFTRSVVREEDVRSLCAAVRAIPSAEFAVRTR